MTAAKKAAARKRTAKPTPTPPAEPEQLEPADDEPEAERTKYRDMAAEGAARARLITVGAGEQFSTLVAPRRHALGQIAPKWSTPPAGTVSTLNRGGGVNLDYMGHADVTLALLDIDPEYEYGWATDETGAMIVHETPDLWLLHGWLRLHDHVHRGIGTCEKRKTEYHKELIGDLLRNTAMRFGIATGLWSRAEAHDQSPAAPPAWDPPPRVRDAYEALAAMSDAGKAKLKAVAETEGRRYNASALAADEAWLVTVEAIIRKDQAGGWAAEAARLAADEQLDLEPPADEGPTDDQIEAALDPPPDDPAEQ